MFLLPFFSEFTQARTRIGLLGDLASWATCLGDHRGNTTPVLRMVLAARWTGLPWRDSVALAPMNTGD